MLTFLGFVLWFLYFALVAVLGVAVGACAMGARIEAYDWRGITIEEMKTLPRLTWRFFISNWRTQRDGSVTVTQASAPAGEMPGNTSAVPEPPKAFLCCFNRVEHGHSPDCLRTAELKKQHPEPMNIHRTWPDKP